MDCIGPALWDLFYPDAAGVIGFGQTGYNPCTRAGGGWSDLYLVGATGVGGSNLVTVHFSLDVAGGAIDPSNYRVYRTYNPTDELGVTGASVTGSTVVLTLDGALLGTGDYTVEVSNVEDTNGNAIFPGSTANFIASGGDTAPPTLVSADGTGGTDQVTVTFSENVIYGASVASNYTVYPTSDPSSPLVVSGATRLNNVVTLYLGSSLAGSTSYTVSVSNVQDAAGNSIASNSTASFTTGGDNTPPTLSSAAGTVGQSTVALTFSETLGAGANTAANYGVFPNADPSSPLTVTAASNSGNQVSLTLGSALAGARPPTR